jgi:hypothetical protein
VVSIVLVLVPLIAGGVTAIVWWPGAVFAALVAVYLAAYVVTTPTAPDRRVSLSMGVAGAIALLSGGSLVLVLGPAAIALPLGRLIVHVCHGPRVARDMFPAEPIGVLVFVLAFAAGLLPVPSTTPAHPGVLSVFGLAALLGFAATVLARSLLSEQRRVVARRLIALRTLEDWPVYTIVYSSVALFAVTAEPMGWWAVPLAGLPYVFSYVSLHRLQGTRRTYDQTIRALGAIPEASGQVASGHSARTAELAVAAGAEIGLGASELCCTTSAELRLPTRPSVATTRSVTLPVGARQSLVRRSTSIRSPRLSPTSTPRIETRVKCAIRACHGRRNWFGLQLATTAMFPKERNPCRPWSCCIRGLPTTSTPSW